MTLGTLKFVGVGRPRLHLQLLAATYIEEPKITI